jgi:hypothetical protein
MKARTSALMMALHSRRAAEEPAWIELSTNQKWQIEAAMRRIAKTRHIVYPIPDGRLRCGELQVAVDGP